MALEKSKMKNKKVKLIHQKKLYVIIKIMKIMKIMLLKILENYFYKKMKLMIKKITLIII